MKSAKMIVAEIERNSATLRRKPPDERRIAVVVADASDAPVVEVLHALAGAGYRVGTLPAEGEALAPSDAEDFSRADYAAWFSSLPRATQDAVAARWGTPEQDPSFRPGRLDCGTFAIPASRFGNVAVARLPTRSGDTVPRHGELALHAWLQDGFRADAVVRLGGRGDLEFLPSP